MNPYLLHSRVRVGDEHGTIVHVEPTARPFYHVAFDGDTSPDENDPKHKRRIQNTRVVLHEDIIECWTDGEPANPISVDAELFEKFLECDCVAIGTTSGEKKNKKKGAAAAPTIPPPVLWRDTYWILTGAAYDCDNDQWAHATIYPLAPRTEYAGEIREPGIVHRGYGGICVTCDLGKFVILDKPVAVCPMAPVRIAEDENDDEPIITSNFQKRAHEPAKTPAPRVEPQPALF